MVAGPYESFAITTGKVPTITSMVKWLDHRWWGKLVLWLVIGGGVCHFMRSRVERAIEAFEEHLELGA